MHGTEFDIALGNHASNALRVLQLSQEKLKTMLMQNFWEEIKCIMGDVQVANEKKK